MIISASRKTDIPAFYGDWLLRRLDDMDADTRTRAISDIREEAERLANGSVQSTEGVTAAEYIERRALQTVEHLPAIQPFVHLLGPNSPVILIDVTAPDAASLAVERAKAEAILSEEGATDLNFSDDEARSNALWDVRKGFFASGGAARSSSAIAWRIREGSREPALQASASLRSPSL